MAEGSLPPPPQLDPIGIWRDWLAQTQRQWEVLSRVAPGPEPMTRAFSEAVDAYIGFQQLVSDSTERYLGLAPLTRTDVSDAERRIQELERRITDVERALSDLRTLLREPGPPAFRLRPRTFRAPGANGLDGAH